MLILIRIPISIKKCVSENHRIEYGRTTKGELHKSLTRTAPYNEQGELQKILQVINKLRTILK